MPRAGVLTVVSKTDKLTRVEWSFERFFDDLENTYISSDIFYLGDEVYFLYIDTDVVSNSLDCIPLCVFKSEYSDVDPCVSCTLGVKKPNGCVIQSFDGQLMDCGDGAWLFEYRRFASKSKLLQSMDVETPEEIVTFFCILCHKDSVLATTSVQTEEAVSSSSKAIGTLSQNFKDLFVSQYHGDIKILVDDREFKAHTCVLIARSKVFASMLEHNMAEKNSNVINITDCKPEIFEAFLLFLYSGELNHVTPTNAVDLYNVSEKYNMDEMKEACIQCLASNLSVDSICDVIQLAVVHSESELLRNATEFFTDNMELNHVTPTNAVDLYNVSEKYNMDEMKEACIQCLASNLSVDSICDVIQLAMVHSESELLRSATEFFTDNMEAILITDKWKYFLMENHLVANELFIKMAKRNKTKK